MAVVAAAFIAVCWEVSVADPLTVKLLVLLDGKKVFCFFKAAVYLLLSFAVIPELVSVPS